MNKVILMGRLARDPETRYTDANLAIGRYSLACPRRVQQGQEPAADFVNVVSFGKAAEFAEKYLHKGTKVLVTGRLQTGSYTNKDGQKVYTTDVVAEEQEFCESKTSGTTQNTNASSNPTEGFMNFPDDGIEDDLPFGPVSR